MSSRPVSVLAAIALTLTPVLTAAGQSVAVSPFVSYTRNAETDPLAGFALTFGGTTGLALRSSAEMSVANPRLDSAASQAAGIRPWGADADAMLFLGGIGGGATMFSRALSPYVFAGIGLSGADSAGKNVTHNGWSYGAGASIPLGMFADVFAEARWRMNQYVLPTSDGAPDSRRSMRFGLSFHVGGGGAGVARPPRRIAQREDDDVYVVNPAPAQQPVVVVAPAQTEPQVVVVEQEPAPEPVVIEREPATTPSEPVWRSIPPVRRAPTTVATPRRPVLGTIGRARGAARVLSRGSVRARTPQTTTGGSSARPSRTPTGGTIKVAPRARTRVQGQLKSSGVVSRIKRGTTVRSSKQPK